MLKSQTNDEVFAVADSMPKFPGGDIKFAEYLIKNLQYPVGALAANQTGKTYVKFIVDTLGKIKAPEVIKSSGSASLDQEAVRVISKMPTWEPGLIKNRKVNVFMTMPIAFKNAGTLKDGAGNSK